MSRLSSKRKGGLFAIVVTLTIRMTHIRSCGVLYTVMRSGSGPALMVCCCYVFVVAPLPAPKRLRSSFFSSSNFGMYTASIDIWLAGTTFLRARGGGGCDCPRRRRRESSENRRDTQKNGAVGSHEQGRWQGLCQCRPTTGGRARKFCITPPEISRSFMVIEEEDDGSGGGRSSPEYSRFCSLRER